MENEVSHRNADRTIQPLRLFLPGAFARMGAALTSAFLASSPDGELWFHRNIPSGLLARKIIEGADADIFVSANLRFLDEVRQAGRVLRAEVLAGNRLCVITLPSRSTDVTVFDDLAQPGIRVVAPQAQTDPCGQYVEEAFMRAGLLSLMRFRASNGGLIYSVGSGDLPEFLFDGRADAGILYLSEALALGEQVVIVPVPLHLDLHDEIAFYIAIVERTEDRHPDSDAFVDLLIGDSGQNLLADFGFARARPWMAKPPDLADSPASTRDCPPTRPDAS